MINSNISNLILAKTNLTEVNSENVILGLSLVGWNFKVYDGSIFLNKEKIAVSDSDLSFMRSGITAYNTNHKHRFAEDISF